MFMLGRNVGADGVLGPASLPVLFPGGMHPPGAEATQKTNAKKPRRIHVGSNTARVFV